jgi:hypothetical protein
LHTHLHTGILTYRLGYVDHIQALIPDVSEILDSSLEDKDLRSIQSREFSEYKRRILTLEHLESRSSIDDEAKAALATACFGTGEALPPLNAVELPDDIASRLPWGKRFHDCVVETRLQISNLNDKSVIASAGREDYLRDPRARALKLAISYIQNTIIKKVTHLAPEIRSLQEREILQQIRRECSTRRDAELRSALKQFLEDVRDRFKHNRSS